jgi:hypothetical protein
MQQTGIENVTKQEGTMKRDNSVTGAAGVYYVCAELARRGYLGYPTLRQTRGIDVLASSADGSRGVSLQVKTCSNRKYWMLNEKADTLEHDKLFYVFVMLPADGGAPTFHIVPSAFVAKRVREGYVRWLQEPGVKGQPHNETSQRVISLHEVADYRDRWELLGL